MAPLMFDGTEVKNIKYVTNGVTIEIDKLIFNGVTVFQKESGEYNIVVTNMGNGILYLGVQDMTLDLYEGMYRLDNTGVTYNSYLVMGSTANALINTVDKRAASEFLVNLQNQLHGQTLDYLVINDGEPDMSGALREVVNAYPNVTLVGNAKTFQMLARFYRDLDTLVPTSRRVTVAEGSTLSLGNRTLQFIMTPMVTWPDVMMCYDSLSKTMFSGDMFSSYGSTTSEGDWGGQYDGGTRYYFSCVAKYGVQVQNVLKKTGQLEITTLAPSHGVYITDNLGYYTTLYNTWSSYAPETEAIAIFYASAYGNTASAAQSLASNLQSAGKTVYLNDVIRADMVNMTCDAFRASQCVFASCSINGNMHPAMNNFLAFLKDRVFQNRTVGLIENGSWAPVAVKSMGAALEGMKNITILTQKVTIASTMDATSASQLAALQDALLT